MLGLISCVVGFLMGAGCVYLCTKNQKAPEHIPPVQEEKGSDLRGQWESFLSYNGEEADK